MIGSCTPKQEPAPTVNALVKAVVKKVNSSDSTLHVYQVIGTKQHLYKLRIGDTIVIPGDSNQKNKAEIQIGAGAILYTRRGGGIPDLPYFVGSAPSTKVTLSMLGSGSVTCPVPAGIAAVHTMGMMYSATFGVTAYEAIVLSAASTTPPNAVQVQWSSSGLGSLTAQDKVWIVAPSSWNGARIKLPQYALVYRPVPDRPTEFEEGIIQAPIEIMIP